MRLLLVLAGLLAALYCFARWSLRVGPARTALVLRWTVVAATFLLLALLAARGAGALAGMLLMVLLPLLLRWRDLWHSPLTTGGYSTGPNGPSTSRSSVQSRFLSMALDHDSGCMQGVVLEGTFAGRSLNDLTLKELLDLWQECQLDAQSVALLEAYLDRSQGNWREQVRAQRRPPPNQSMSRSEAYEILGLHAGTSREEIKAAHRRLIQRVHPDHGGSDYLAARINQAKQVLLGD